jgi:putative ABC transport system ATP-binding protein
MHTNLLCKSFISDGEINNVIKNLNLEINRGDFTVIMGSSGSGKSTLIYSLSGMTEVTSGEVFLAGSNITHKSEKDMAEIRRNKIGFIFQSMNLIPDLTAYENIFSPTYRTGKDKKESIKKVNTLLEQMDLEEHKNKFPNQLSGGQKQRVAICRALVNNPDILFADEPTGSLNSSQGEHVLDLLSEIYENGQSVVMVTHDLKAALRGNRIIYLKDGRIDGDLMLDSFQKLNIIEREQHIYEFLKERGW